MNHKYLSKIASVALVFAVYLIAVGSVFGCWCRDITICQTYYFADAVFIGKVEKIEKATDSPFDAQNVTFTVSKTYKGNVSKIEVARFGIKTDCGNSFEIGETYFVYKYKGFNPCNETDLLKNMSRDVEYAESLSQENPVFFINGRIETSDWKSLTAEELKNTRITIEKGQTKYNVEPDKFGNFKFKTAEKGIYRVKITLPFKAEVDYNPNLAIFFVPLETSTTETQTTAVYEVEFMPNGCVYLGILTTRAKQTDKSALLRLTLNNLINNPFSEMNKNPSVLRPV